MVATRAFVRCTFLSVTLLVLLAAVPKTDARAIDHGYTLQEIDKMRFEGHEDHEITQPIFGHPAPSFLHPSHHSRNQKSAGTIMVEFFTSHLPSSSPHNKNHVDDFELIPGQAASRADHAHQQRLLTQKYQQRGYLPRFMRGASEEHVEALEKEMSEQRDRLRPKWILPPEMRDEEMR